MRHGVLASSHQAAAAPVYGDEICQLVEFTPSAPTQVLNFNLDGRTPNLILFSLTGATQENASGQYNLDLGAQNVCHGAWSPTGQGYVLGVSAEGVSTKVERAGNSNSSVIAIAAPGSVSIEASAAVTSTGDDTFTLTWTGTPTRALRIMAVVFHITNAAYVHKYSTAAGISTDTLGFLTEGVLAWSNNSYAEISHGINTYVSTGGYTMGLGTGPANQSSAGYTDSNGIASDYRGGPEVNSTRSSINGVYVRSDIGGESTRQIASINATQIAWDRDVAQTHVYLLDWAYVALNINGQGIDYQEIGLTSSFDQSFSVGFRPGLLICQWSNTRFEHLSGTETFDNKVNFSCGYVFDDGASGIQKVQHWNHRFNVNPSAYQQTDFVEGFPVRDSQHVLDATRMAVVTLEPTGYRVQAGSAASGVTYLRVLALNIEKVL